jgi:2-polyprenyl-3-methyl-5-hydroxy-6-metoxy-1,4-benzoquinol methylase
MRSRDELGDDEKFDPRTYWERRLDAEWTQQGVGHASLGRNLNKWQYRLRHERFAQVVKQAGIEPATSRVLDVGSGTGEYLRGWRTLGVQHLTAMDLTDAAVTRLRGRFPEVTVVRGDITEDPSELPHGHFDVISCMDVLFHVTDDDRYAAALRNIGRLLKPGGFLVWSDLFVHGQESSGGHIVWRSLARAEEAVRAAGLDVILRAPLFWLMNEPRDTRIPGVLPAWKGGMWLVSRNERVADAIGAGLWRLDRRLTSSRRESPSTEIMVCRRREIDEG